jgi:isopenicillin-N N-acyltransferase-like protein
MRKTLGSLLVFAAAALVCPALSADPVERAGGTRQRMNGYLVLHLRGTPEQMGRQHGLLLKSYVQRMIRDLILEGEADTPEEHARLVAGAMVMDEYLEPEFRQELRALAEAAEVDYGDLVLAQLFGDVQRALPRRSYTSTTSWDTPSSTYPTDDETPAPDPWMQCTSFAVFGPATKTGECIVGRNMDFWDQGVSSWGAVLIHYKPDRGIPFMTTSWAGIINGWTAMNARGIVTANNTSYDGKSDSLEGLSTCFMVRKVAQYAATVEEGVEIVENTPRACGTNLTIAGGDPPNAAIVEYDHENVAVRWAEDGAVWAANDFQKLYQREESSYSYYYSSRYDRLKELIEEHHGRIDRTMNFAAAEGVPLRYINLHSALIFTRDLRFNVSMSLTPAADHWYRPFRLTPDGIEAVGLEEAWRETYQLAD